MKFRFRLSYLLLLLIFTSLFCISCGKTASVDNKPQKAEDGKIHIIYWRHFFSTEEKTIRELIKKYEEKNPHIKIDFSTLPFSTYSNKLATSIAAGTGPHIINIHTSWAYNFVKSNRLRALPEELMTTKEVESNFFPLIKSFKMHGEYYGLPIGSGCLALYYNVKLFKDAGLDPDKPPKTWKEMIEYAKKLTKRHKNGRLETAGLALGSPEFGQGWNYILDSLIPQNNGKVINEEGTKVLWNTPEGIEAFSFYTDCITKYKVNSYLFPKPSEAFKLGKCGMMIDGNWAIGDIERKTYTKKNYDADVKAGRKTKEIFKYAIAPVPMNKKKSVHGSYWANCVTSRAVGTEILEAWKFVNFLASEESMLLWVDKVKELPMRKSLVKDDSLKNKYPELVAFLDQLPYSYVSLKKNESVYKGAITNAIERVIIQNSSVKDAMKIAENEVNIMLQKE